MNDEIKDEKPAEAPGKVELPKLPGLEAPTAQYSRDTNTIWIGIPVHKFSPIDLLLIVDSVKTDVIGAHRDFMFREQQKSKLIVPKTGGFNAALNNTKNFLTGKR